MATSTMTNTAPAVRTKRGELMWADLAATDLERQTAFYEGLFGWTHTDMATAPGQPAYRFFMLGGSMVAGASPRDPRLDPDIPSMWSVYFAADDAEEMARTATGLGGGVAVPARDVMDQGRIVGIKDPSGATFFLWQGKERAGAQVFGQPGSIAWADLSSRDPEAVAPFYQKVVGWEIERYESGSMPYWMAKIGGQGEAGIMPMAPDMPESAPSSWLVYFGVEDAARATDKALSLGAKPLMDAPMDVGTTIFDILQDPAGAVFAIMTPVREM